MHEVTAIGRKSLLSRKESVVNGGLTTQGASNRGMATDESEKPGAFWDAVPQLTERDLIIELVAGAGAFRRPDLLQCQFFEHAIERSYRALAGGAEPEIERVAVLDELSKQTLSVWLRAQVRASDAEAEDPALLKFLARGTLALIAWMDGSRRPLLQNLQQAIRVLAWGTSVTTTAHPPLPSSAKLVRAIESWQQAKDAAAANHSVRIISASGSVELDLFKRIVDPGALLVAKKLVNHSVEIIFVVDRPDYLGSHRWRLRHGEAATEVLVQSGTLLDKFPRREIDVRPGDALRCRADVETSYGPDNEVLAKNYQIVQVLEIMPARWAEREALRTAATTAVPGHSAEFETAS